MRKIIIFSIFLLFAGTISCSNAQEQKRTKILISTSLGDITIELYNETPLHRDNFIKLAEENFYNGLLFHRVIKNFMIQGGDPNSKNAEAGKTLGNGGPGYQIPAEFIPEFYHKKGALAAARQGDRTNPEKKSSGSQFYIIHGTIYSEGQLDTLETKINYSLQQKIMQQYYNGASEELNKFRQANDQDGYNKLIADVRAKADSAFEAADKITIPEERRKDYTTIGGYPSLDGEYTIFGQVIDGIEVIDKIAAVKTDQRNRPVEDISFEVKIIK